MTNDSHDELLELVRAANPLDERDLIGWIESAEAADIRDQIHRKIQRDKMPSRRERRHRPLLFVSVGVAILASVAAGYVIGSRATTEVFTVGCASEPGGEDMAIVALKEGSSPEQTCIQEWQYQNEEIPTNVVACVIKHGGTVVYPNPANMAADKFCSSIGASSPAYGNFYGGLTSEGVRQMARDLDGALQPLQEGEECYPVVDLKERIDDFLRENELDEWKIDDRTTPDYSVRASNGQRCARYVLEPLAARILVVDGDLKP